MVIVEVLGHLTGGQVDVDAVLPLGVPALDGGARDAASLRRALKTGRSVATNAPLLGLRLQEAGPGELVTRAPGASAAVPYRVSMRSTVPISRSISRQAWLAPPWAGPQRQAMPAAMQANGLAPEDPARRTVEVEAFCS